MSFVKFTKNMKIIGGILQKKTEISHQFRTILLKLCTHSFRALLKLSSTLNTLLKLSSTLKTVGIGPVDSPAQ